MDQINIISSLIERGWYCSESFLDPLLSQELLRELHTHPLKMAKTGKLNAQQNDSAFRTDSLYWLDENSESHAQKEYLEEMDNLMKLLNRELFLGLKQFEGHFAQYDKNGFYKKHLDQIQGSRERVVSVISYLNTPCAEGKLRIFKRENPEEIETDITPKAGTLVCFLSNQIYHEVRPTAGPRFSIAGWLRTTIL